MRKTTLKISAFLLLTMFVFQTQAQVTSIVEGTKYTLQNFGDGNYLKATGDGAYEMSATLPTDDVTFNFFFNHHNSVDPDNGTVYSYMNDWNIGNDVRGIMRASNTSTVHTNFKYNQFNANGGLKTDKRWEETTLVQSSFTTFRFSPLTDNSEGTNSNPDRFLYQGVDGVVYNISVADMNDETITYTDGEARSYWLLAESTIVLSNEKFDTSSIFISNPVKNQISIKGLTSNIKQVSLYSLLGQEVLTRKIGAQSSLNIDISALKSGMYLVEMKGENATFTKKIVKQ